MARLRAAFALALVASTPLVAAPAAAACDGIANGRVSSRPGGWRHLGPAPFDDGPDRTDVVGFAVSDHRRDRIYVTNGSSVQRTLDGGCFWTTVLRRRITVPEPTQTAPEVVSRVVAMDIPRGARHRDVLWVLLEDASTPVPRPAVAVTRTGGSSWDEGAAGLPPGRARLLSAVSDQTAYVVVRAADAVGDLIYATVDGGRTWDHRGLVELDGALTGIRADPSRFDWLWAWDRTGVLLSTDGGRSFDRRTAITDAVAALDVTVGPDDTSRVAIVHADFPLYSESHDAGDSWSGLDLPFPATSVSLARSVVAVAGSAGIVLHAPGGSTGIGPTGVHPRDVRVFEDEPAVEVFAHDPAGVLYRRVAPPRPRRPSPFVTQLPGVDPLPSLPPVELDPAEAVRLGKSVLLPADHTVRLRPGERREVRYQLHLAPVPSPLDVYFVVDTTGSMGGTIAGLRRGIGSIVDELAGSGIDAHFGLAHFEDYPITPFGGPGDKPYERLRAIGPPDAELQSAIEGLELGGGGDGPESDLPALYQSATGAGQFDKGLGEGSLIAPGQQAGFREDSLRVIALATDAPFHQPPGYPGPSFAATVDALRREGIQVVGLAVGGGGLADLVDMSEATGAFAPYGTDCDGDGDEEVAEGAPLVCRLENASTVNLAPAIIGLLSSLRDEATISLHVDRGGEVARVVAPSERTGVNVRVRNRLEFTVEFACPATSAGAEVPVHLHASRAGEPVVGAQATVECVAPVVPQPPAPEPPAPQAAPAPPAPAPQQPLRLEQNPNPQQQTQPQWQPQTHANAAVAAEQQQQHQVALAYADVGAPEEQFAMVRRDEPPLAALLYAGALVATAAAAAAAHAHARAPAPARVAGTRLARRRRGR